MSRSRFDSALASDMNNEASPGEGLHMHELESDGEDDTQQHEGGDDFAIQEDDVEDMEVSTKKEQEKQPTSAPTPSLQTLPSYQALMNSLSHDPEERKSAASASSSSAAAILDDSRYIQDDVNAQVGSGSDNDELDESQLQNKVHSFEEMFSRAKRLETKGFLRKAAHYYLYCLEHFRYSHQHQDLIAMCLRRLGDICYKNKKYKEALQFRTAERMVYESNLLRIVKSDAEKEDAIARSSAPTSPSNAATSSSSSSSSAAAPLSNKNSRIMSQQSADPTPIIRTPITPKALIAEEERALTYERLAKVFFEEKNIDMAKSYALKAIEIRRRIKAKYGDPSKLDPEQLLLHQLAVMGQEEYETTLRRFKGQPSAGVQGLLSSEMDNEAEDEETEEGKTVSNRAAAKEAQMKFAMAKSLQAITSGKLNPKPAAAAKDAHDNNGDEEEEKKESDKLRQRKGGKQVNFKDASSKPADADDHEKSGPKDDHVTPSGDASKSDDVDVSSVVIEKPAVSTGTKRRALAVSLLAGVVVILIAYYLITVTFRSTFFKPTGTGAFATK